MTVASTFEFTFPKENAEEGFTVATSIGADMPATSGYVDHQVIRDVADSGHVLVITHWNEQSEGEAVLGDYIHDAKVVKATDLAGGTAPRGFLGVVQPR